jgi:GNAT superfamily N-acetyltransferase
MDVCLIPRRLLEQVKLRDWPVERFYALNGAITQTGLLYGWVDNESIVRGFLWANISPLDCCLHVHLLSVDRDYQGKGVMQDSVDLCTAIADQFKLCGIVAWTRGARAFQRLGFESTGEQKCVKKVPMKYTGSSQITR